MAAQAKVTGAKATEEAIRIAKIVRKTDTLVNVRPFAVMMTTMPAPSRAIFRSRVPEFLSPEW
jgi:hypothetical protein